MTYYDELTRAMTILGEHPKSIFYGQAIAYEGTGMTASFKNVPRDKLVELPVFENVQAGLCIGESLCGALPICIYPRVNFMLEAMSQIVQHLDKLPLYSDYRPHVIIRTAIATDNPLNPGPQHIGDVSPFLAQMLDTVRTVWLEHSGMIVPEYEKAAKSKRSTILIEYAELYNAE
jgi:pyruvate/2-oxoglutarate/acetoin dehydrogenase E1 component